ncbi:MAG: glycoside hydrolase family 5 [Candidatus Marinimicrobia bacterium]|nr:glycoside hydrolase family 5 [Candidatus Neomarinimicrobiota bacterium]|tara:strand:+ start:6180 stop:8150 length:1971 start_codon:yes stop_codon:yes gene_type:complete
MRLIIAFIFSLYLIFAQGFLHNVNGDIVEGNGEPILLRGFGLGGWLVPEGYMLHNQAWIAGFESPTEIEDHIENLIGEEAAEDFWNLYRTNYVAQADIEQIAEWGFNHIRVPFHYKQFYDSTGTETPIGYAIIDELISWCEPYNMYIILDMHCAPGGQNGGPISDSDGTARLWLEESNKELTIQIWKEIASYYADNTLIGGYDLINEPVLPGGVTLEEFKQLYIDITNAIREVDNNHLLFIEGNWYGTDFAGLTPPWDENMSYSFHKYWGQTDLSTIQSYINMRNNYGVPLWMGESGENSNHWYYEVFKLLEENNIGWNFWTHKKVDKITSPFSAYVSPQYQIVIDYLSGNSAQPTPDIAGIGLTSFANSLKIENCLTRRGVVAALTDSEYGEVTKPYVPHAIPGTIPAAYYDIGARGLSYSDSDYWNDGDGGYNDGWVFRNDGVDVEGSDNLNIPYTVGWTEAGEWLGYTIQDVTPGTYNVTFSVSAPEAGGIFYAQLSGQNLGVIDVPATGGWYNWDDIPAQTVAIDEGEKFLKIQIVQAGFNIQSIWFEPTMSVKNDNINPSIFQLGKPYPNPFNPFVNMDISVSKPDIYNISIYNIKGELINDWKTNFLESGNYNFTWNALDANGNQMPSGLFFISVNSQKITKQKKVILLR